MKYYEKIYCYFVVFRPCRFLLFSKENGKRRKNGYNKFAWKGILAATYNEKGKLIRVVENYKNVILPSKVIYSIYKKFPQWTIVNDKFLYTQTEGDIVKKQYNVKIKKGKDIRKLVVRPDGTIVKGL